MLTQYKLIAIAVVAVFLFGTGGTLAYKYQASKVQAANAQRDAALAANKEQHTTVDELTARITAGQADCEKRLAAKDALRRNLQAIDNLKSKPEVTTNETATHFIADDPILFTLNSMWTVHQNNLH